MATHDDAGADPLATPLRIVYRSYAGENRKGRVPYYSKYLALLSLVRAARAMPRAPELVFVNDGPIPPPRLELMTAVGDVVPIDAGSNRRSYRWTVAREAAAPGPDDGIVWFAEDDYLYRPEALSALAVGAAALPHGDYFTLYGSEAVDTAAPRWAPRPRALPAAAGDPAAVEIGGATWYRALSSASTFGVRRRVLAEDARLLRLCPLTGGAWDFTSCLTYQGLLPFTPREIVDDLRRAADPSWGRSAIRAAVRTGVASRALRRPSRRRVLLGTDPELIRHLEVREWNPRTPESAGTAAVDWEGLAVDTRRWGSDAGLPGADGSEDTIGDRR